MPRQLPSFLSKLRQSSPLLIPIAAAAAATVVAVAYAHDAIASTKTSGFR